MTCEISSLTAGLILFSCMVVLQIAMWHMWKISRPTAMLFTIFFVLPVLAYLILVVTGRFDVLYVTKIGVLFALLAAAYVQTYPALQEDIPSFQILLYLDSRAPHAILEDELTKQLANGSLFDVKLNDLIDEAWVVPKGDQLYLTKKGRLVARIFLRYRRWLGLDLGEG